MTATHSDRAADGAAPQIEAPAAEQAGAGPLTHDPAITAGGG